MIIKIYSQSEYRPIIVLLSTVNLDICLDIYNIHIVHNIFLCIIHNIVFRQCMERTMFIFSRNLIDFQAVQIK